MIESIKMVIILTLLPLTHTQVQVPVPNNLFPTLQPLTSPATPILPPCLHSQTNEQKPYSYTSHQIFYLIYQKQKKIDQKFI